MAAVADISDVFYVTAKRLGILSWFDFNAEELNEVFDSEDKETVRRKMGLAVLYPLALWPADNDSIISYGVSTSGKTGYYVIFDEALSFFPTLDDLKLYVEAQQAAWKNGAPMPPEPIRFAL